MAVYIESELNRGTKVWGDYLKIKLNNCDKVLLMR
jgi:hypothetical protein